MASTVSYVDGTQTVELIGTNVVKAQNSVDFSAVNITAGDTAQCLKIPAKAYVYRVIVRVDTAEGATCTATVGDGDDPNGYDASANLNASANTVTTSLAGTDAYAEGRYYSAADTIDLVMGHDTDAAIVTVAAFYAIIE